MWIGMAEHFFCKRIRWYVCVWFGVSYLFVHRLLRKTRDNNIYAEIKPRTCLDNSWVPVSHIVWFSPLFPFDWFNNLWGWSLLDSNLHIDIVVLIGCLNSCTSKPWMGAVSRANFPPIFAVTFYHCHHPAGLTRQMLERERSFGSDILGQMPLAPHYQT